VVSLCAIGVLVNQPGKSGTVGTEDIVGRVVELDQLRVREQPFVSRPILFSDKDAVAAANDKQRKLQCGKLVPEGPAIGRPKGFHPGVVIDALVHGRSAPTPVEQST